MSNGSKHIVITLAAFIFFGSRLKAIPKSYERYLINSLRTDFNLIGVPIRIFFRANENPYRPK